MRKVFCSVLACAMAVVLSACGSSEDKADGASKLPQPKAGQCVAKGMADENDRVPDLATIVPCNKPHTFEIVGVHDVPKEFLAGKGKTDKQKLARRSELASIDKERTELGTKLRDAIWPKCQQSQRSASGLGGITMDGVSAADADVSWPNSAVRGWINVTSPKLWLDGKAQVICSAHFVKLDDHKFSGSGQAVASKDTKQLITKMYDGSDDFPVSLRGCFSKDDKYVTCTKKHDFEVLWRFDAKKVFGKDFGRGHDASDLTKKQTSQIDDACRDGIRSLGYDSVADNWDTIFVFPKSADSSSDAWRFQCALQAPGNQGYTIAPGFLLSGPPVK